MIRIHQVMCPLTEAPDRKHIAKKLRCSPQDILSFEIERESLDARGDRLSFSYTVLADVKRPERFLRMNDVSEGKKEVYRLPLPAEKAAGRPVVAGFGPAGMFAALILAEAGMRPVVLERGKPAEERAKDVEAYFREGILDPESNVQYGEGGAGTFSDGKLTTRIKNNVRIQKVYEELTEAGADPRIRYQARPHLGTDALQKIVPEIRKKILSLQGEVLFGCRLESLDIRNGKLQGVYTSKGYIPCTDAVLALGHSAHETFSSLLSQGIVIEQKDFAAGVRVEHPQAMIDRRQYGEYAGHPALSAASYSLTFRSSNGRGVYSFCMCPGGIVIPVSTEEGTLAVNGMSYSQRSGQNANSAILVQIPKKDFDRGHPLDGFRAQKALEQKAYRDGFRAPAMNIRDYMEHRVSQETVIPSSFPRGILTEDMHRLFSDPVNASLHEGFLDFDRKIPGFIQNGIMVGAETRSSSPVRMVRSDSGESISCAGVYPCGEGAGYAGGIVSSAVDGIRQAENIIRRYGIRED